jgi:DNA-binding NtrC family response regulator
MSSREESGTETLPVVPTDSLRVQLESIDLRVVGGPDEGLRVNLCLPTVRIGTAPDNDIVLTDRAVSRHHAEIRMTQQGLMFRDLGSTNGTFIGTLRIQEAYLAPETECIMGYTHIVIRSSTEERPVSISRDDHLGALVGGSERMRELYGLVRAVAPTPATVHITGESGSGKELVARTIHELSGRQGPLVVFDASVTDPEMVRNDLFGHVKGAFTGATGSREGAFRRADGGTLFIDEIGELPLDLQPRLLRALESREVTPIGSDKPMRVDARVVTATHRDLQAMVQVGDFRADLFYRLSVVPIRVPPLREVSSDIPLLVRHLIDKLDLNCRVPPETMAVLQRYPWPGNVRELRNVLERAAVFNRGGFIQPQDLHLPAESLDLPAEEAPLSSLADLKPAVQATLPKADEHLSLGSGSASMAKLKELERRMILEAMARHGNNKAAVARELGIPLSTLKRRLKDYQD